jgi:hypothetical protein
VGAEKLLWQGLPVPRSSARLNDFAHFVRGRGWRGYGQLLALWFIATLLVGFSAWRFRGQMS